MPQDLTDVVLLKGYRFRIDFNDDCAVYANEVSGLDAEFDVAGIELETMFYLQFVNIQALLNMEILQLNNV